MLQVKTTTKFSNTQLEQIATEAFIAAKEAETAYKAQHGENPYCGFAWVNITPGNSPIANYLKANGAARKSYSKGVDVWNPGRSATQSMDVKEEGAHAFANVLRKYGFTAYPMSRAD